MKTQRNGLLWSQKSSKTQQKLTVWDKEKISVETSPVFFFIIFTLRDFTKTVFPFRAQMEAEVDPHSRWRQNTSIPLPSASAFCLSCLVSWLFLTNQITSRKLSDYEGEYQSVSVWKSDNSNPNQITDIRLFCWRDHLDNLNIWGRIGLNLNADRLQMMVVKHQSEKGAWPSGGGFCLLSSSWSQN